MKILVKSLFFIAITCLSYQIFASAPAKETEKITEFWEEIAHFIAGQPVNKNVLDSVVTFAPFNKFNYAELVAVPRSSGGYTYGFINSDLHQTSFGVDVYSIDVGKGQEKQVLVRQIGKIKGEPTVYKWMNAK